MAEQSAENPVAQNPAAQPPALPLTVVSDASKSTPEPEKKGRPPASPFLILVALGCLGGSVAAAWNVVPGWNFIVTAACLSVFLLVMGQTITGTPFAALINERNLMSLSQLQATVWSVIVVSGLMALSLTALRTAGGDITKILGSVNVEVPEQLWVMMGVSISSLVGTPLILSTKKEKKPGDNVVQQAADKLNVPPEEIQQYRQGALFGNPQQSDARFSDMFEGDEVGNTANLDLAKVQMFFFTILSAIVYGAALFHAVQAGATQAVAAQFKFPELSSGMVALLAVSHGGYLASKLPDRSTSTPA